MITKQHLLRYYGTRSSLISALQSKLTTNQCRLICSQDGFPPRNTLTHYPHHHLPKTFRRPIATTTSSSIRQCAALSNTARYTTVTTRVYFSTTPSDRNEDGETSESSEPPPPNADHKYDYEGIDAKTRREMQKRHQGIEMNPDGLSQLILPGEYVVKTNQKTGSKKMVSIERSLGYFWTIKDLKDSNNKPILSNSKLIPSDIAQVFPPLGDVGKSLTTLTDERITLPRFFTRNNRSMDESAHCTLVAINFNAFGYQMLPSWTEPFEEAFSTNDSNRVEVVRLSIQEGTTLWFLRYLINRGYQKNVADGDKGRMAMYYGYCPELRDVLRMHNNKTGYVYLLDGLGRVRFAGSGKATQDEIDRMIEFVNELTPGLRGPNASKNKQGSHGKGGKRIR